MATITFTVKDSKASTRIRNAFKGIYQIPQIPVNEKDPSKGTKPLYTDAEWVRQKVIEFIKNTVRRHEEIEARKALQVQDVEDIVS